MKARPHAHAVIADREPFRMTSLALFLGGGLKEGRHAQATELAADYMRYGCPSIAVPEGLDPATIRWPAVPRVAVFEYDALSDAEVRALADALVQAGCDEVFFAGSAERKRGPLTYMAVG